MSSIRCLAILPLLLAACAAGTTPEADPRSTTGGAEAPSGPGFMGPPAPEPPDPCVKGYPIVAGGIAVVAPIPCAGFWMDTGDPPPDTVGAHLYDGATYAATPAPESGTALR